MSWRLRHEWVAGLRMASYELSVCSHCDTLRVVDVERGASYRRPREEPQPTEPVCVSPIRREKSAASKKAQRAFAAGRHVRLSDEERRASLAHLGADSEDR